MKSRTLFTAALIATLSLTASAATLVVPAAGTGPGAAGSRWQSELTFHNAAPRAAQVSVSLHKGTTVVGPVVVALQARETLSIADILRTRFALESGAGALVIDADDRDARSLVVTSRTSNVFEGGEFGQDIPAIDQAAAARAGDIATVPGPSTAAGNRLNFGIYAVEASSVTWQLVRAGGVIAASASLQYPAGSHAQYSSGIVSLLGATPADNDTVYARIDSGKAIVYGSVINATGDPTYVPGVRTRDDIHIVFAGIDLDENGTVDLADANGDGVLDSPVQIYTSMFPAHFRLVAAGEFGETVTFEVVSTPTRTDLLDGSGTMRVIALSDVNGKSGEIVVKASSGNSSSLLTIPVQFK